MALTWMVIGSSCQTPSSCNVRAFVEKKAWYGYGKVAAEKRVVFRPDEDGQAMRFKMLADRIELVAALLIAAPALAQTPHPDVPLLPSAGVFPMACHSPVDLDMAQICFIRVDVDPPLPLGCVPCGPDEGCSSDLTVPVTPNNDAEIKCYAEDTGGLVGDNSDNSGIIDFSKPGKPSVVSTPPGG
ncbi:MAG: hypothetical protein JRF63_10775 [Deltaproteobacteria bacterium]|nr:hypothetical protein [Deltaproteobacteria bacterium]